MNPIQRFNHLIEETEKCIAKAEEMYGKLPTIKI